MSPHNQRFLDQAYEPRSDAEMKAFYDRWAAVYDDELAENAYRQPVRCADALKRLMAPRHGRTVLDVGCGSGLSGVALRSAGFDLIDGCDFSPGMLAKAKEGGLYRRLFEANLNQPPMDADEDSYDAATCVGVFSFGHVMADALDDILRIIKPGGALVIGLNDRFYEEGSLTRKLEALSQSGGLEIVAREHGDHMPGTGLKGWVVSARKAG